MSAAGDAVPASTAVTDGSAAAAGAEPLAAAMGGLGLGGAAAGGQADMMQRMLQSPMTQVGVREAPGATAADREQQA